MGVRWRRLGEEAWRYLAVGLGATIVSILLFNLLVHGFNTGAFAPLNHNPEAAFVIASAIGMAISYHGTRTWAFQHRYTNHVDGGVAAFVAINVVTMLIPVGFLWISRNALGLDDPLSDNIAANVLGLALANAARFLLFRTLVFSQPLGDLVEGQSSSADAP